MARCISASLERLRVPASCLPSMSIRQTSSGFMKPLHTMVGVHRNSRSLSRAVMLPSLAAVNPLAYTRRPISQICSFSLCSFIEALSFQLSAFSSQGSAFHPLDQGRQHAFHLDHILGQRVVV